MQSQATLEQMFNKVNETNKVKELRPVVNGVEVNPTPVECHPLISEDKTVAVPYKFQAMCFPSEAVDPKDVKYPMMSSNKLDGIRAIFIDGMMLSRQKIPIRNKQIRERFQHLMDYSKAHDVILDGELYSHELTFQQITHFIMTEDLKCEKSLKNVFAKTSGSILPESLHFCCFDIVNQGNYKQTAQDRYKSIPRDLPYMSVLEQRIVNNPDEVQADYQRALSEGFEGLILKSPTSPYKCGRWTPNEAKGAKFKPYVTLDAIIIGIVQATKAKEGSARTINEQGYSETSHKKADRVLVDKAAAFLVKYEGKDLKVTIAATDAEKREIWANQKKYIGEIVEYKAMFEGAKDVPRHAISVRVRFDKQGVC